MRLKQKKKGITFFLVILFTEPPSLGFSLCKGSSLTELLPCPLLFLEKNFSATDRSSSFIIPFENYSFVPQCGTGKKTLAFSLGPCNLVHRNPFIRLQSLESEGSSLNIQGKLFLIKPQPMLPWNNKEKEWEHALGPFTSYGICCLRFLFVPSEIMPMHAYQDKNLMVSWPSSHSPQYYSVFIKVIVLVQSKSWDADIILYSFRHAARTAVVQYYHLSKPSACMLLKYDTAL